MRRRICGNYEINHWCQKFVGVNPFPRLWKTSTCRPICAPNEEVKWLGFGESLLKTTMKFRRRRKPPNGLWAKLRTTETDVNVWFENTRPIRLNTLYIWTEWLRVYYTIVSQVTSKTECVRLWDKSSWDVLSFDPTYSKIGLLVIGL